jgi:hypothetical protein
MMKQKAENPRKEGHLERDETGLLVNETLK